MFNEKEIAGHLNLFLLHDEGEDFSPQRWIRARIGDPLKCSIGEIIAEICNESRSGKKAVYEDIARQIAIETGYWPSYSSIKAWVGGTYHTPLIFLSCLLEHHARTVGNNGKEGIFLPSLGNMSSGSRTSWVAVRVPNVITADLAYFLGLVTGDGSLPNVKDKRGDRIYEIKFDGANLEFFRTCYCPLVFKLFGKWPRLSKRARPDGRVSWQAVIGAKPVFRLLTRLFGMPIGRKYEIVRMPVLVRSSGPETRSSFIRGLFDTDGSIASGSRIALYSKSRLLLEDVASCLDGLAMDCELYEYNGRSAPEFQLYVDKGSTENFISSVGSNHPNKRKALAELAAKRGIDFSEAFLSQGTNYTSVGP